MDPLNLSMSFDIGEFDLSRQSSEIHLTQGASKLGIQIGERCSELTILGKNKIVKFTLTGELRDSNRQILSWTYLPTAFYRKNFPQCKNVVVSILND